MWKNSPTAILANMGKIKIPDSLEPFVEGIALNVNVSRNAPVSIAVASCNNSTRIMVTTMLKERDIIREFFRILTRDGLELKVRSNLREDKRYVL